MGERLARKIGGDFRIQGTRTIMSKRGGSYIAAAVAMGTDCNDIDARLPVSLIECAIPISPLNELEPIRLTSINEGLRMDAAEAASQSPMNNLPFTTAPQLVVCGANETNEFHRQADIYSREFATSERVVKRCTLSACDHFDELNRLADDESQFVKPTKAMRFSKSSSRMWSECFAG